MLNKKEIVCILLAIVILGFSMSLWKGLSGILYTMLAISVLLAVNIVAKKIMAYYLESEAEIRLWEVQRYGFKPSRYFKKPFPAGALFPIVFSLISMGYVVWLASLVFEVKAKVYRAAKRHGLYSFSEMTEYHIGLIAAAGIFANLIIAVVGYLINQPEFAKLNIFFAFFNMLPLSDLDGNKIFFGSLILWSFLASVVLIGMVYAFMLV
ncbi:MAG: hypothetical protein KKA64_01915 [Nanoarchaeota archaeon]|nr:hypothetical protein [Nanoarchaeota archaeon]